MDDTDMWWCNELEKLKEDIVNLCEDNEEMIKVINKYFNDKIKYYQYQ